MKISYQILLVFVVVIVICLGISGWFLLQISENIIINKISDGDTQLAQRVGQEVKSQMANIKPVLELFTTTQEWRQMDAKAIKNDLNLIESNFLDITEIYVADSEGNQIAKTGSDKLENVSKIWSFQLAMGGEEIISDIFLDPQTSKPTQIITLPIIDNRKAVGVLSAEIDFEKMMFSIKNIDVGRDGSLFVVTNNGRVVAHTYIEQLSDLNLSGSPVVEAVLTGQTGMMEGYIDELGHQVIGTYVPIWELGWGVVIQRTLTDISIEVEQVRNTILLSIIISVLSAVLAGWLMSKIITKPIGLLANASEKVAQGDLHTLVKVKSSNEIGVLASSFNQMVVSLRKSRNELNQWGKEMEKKVEKRTEELEHANLKLQELDRLKSMFIASMSHELRTPLTSIIGFTGIILQGMSGEINSEQEKQLTLVKNSANHLLDLINDVIDISKIEAGKVEIVIEEFDLSILAQEIKDSFTVAVDKKGLKLSLEIPPTLVIKNDERRTKQILVNFISNAVKFTDRGGIEIKLVKRDKTAEISVRDTGLGVKKEDMNKLFKDFSRIPIKDRTIAGTGLGLYLSKKIADLLGGEIKAESEFGKGSVFTLTLPLKYKEEKV
jgi:signal transduction histidine kinase